jgi:OPA family glycerol-3-phosphate transporter-like MFS transporter
MNFSSYLFAGLAEPLIGGMLDATGNTSLIFVVVTAACLCSASVALFIRR